MTPKQDQIYARGQSKSVAQSARMIISSDDEQDLEYVLPGTFITFRVAHAARAKPKKIASDVVIASQSDEEGTLTGTSSGSATNEERMSGSLGVSWSEKASKSARSLHPPQLYILPCLMRPTVHNPHPVHKLVLLPRLPTSPIGGVSTGNISLFQCNVLNDKGVMTRTLTLEWRVLTGSLPTIPEIHNLFTRHRLEWTARPLGRYSEELVREFYASYIETLRSKIDSWDAPAK